MMMMLSFPPSHQHLKQNRPNPPPLPAFPRTAAAGIGSSSNPTPTSTTHTSTREYFNKVKIIPTTTTRGRRWTAVSSSENQTVVTAPTTTSSSPSVEYTTAAEVVRSFYGGINSHDLASVEDLISDNCVYEDLIFTRPFVGRKAILEFFQKFIDSISTDLQFVIDDISDEDTSAVGVMWHLEWKRKPFPFSKGCSFYRLDVVNGKRQITYGRDCVEPATKPGEMALVVIRGVTWLLQQFPQLADQL